MRRTSVRWPHCMPLRIMQPLLLCLFRVFWMTLSSTSCSYLTGAFPAPESSRFASAFCSWQDRLCPIATQGCQVAKTFYLLSCCDSANRTLLSGHAMTLVHVENRTKSGMLNMSLDRLTSHAGHYATDYREHYVL